MYGLLRGFVSPEYFLNFFPNLYIPPWLWKNFKFMVLRSLENTSATQKIEYVFTLFIPPSKTHPQVFIINTVGRRKLLISPKHFLKIYFSTAERGEDYGAKKWPKLDFGGYWTKVLINSTFLATFTFLVSVFIVP